MTEQPAGWYPDPFAAVAGATRYWDGERWTSHAQAPTPEPQPAQQELRATGRSLGWAQPPAGHPERAAERSQSADADGQLPLASWGRRLGAYLLDLIPMVVITMIMLQMLGVVDAMSSALEAEDPTAIDQVNAMLSPLSATGLTITIANLVFAALYNIGFHVTRGATPGKMLVGIRVRQVDEDRNPELRAAGLRWLVQFGPGVVNGVPLLGFLAGIFSIADHLWPNWDSRNQAFHDKAGRTLVVRSR
ncbi:RDD family protein [Agrococcus sp. ARC_14]|uniref:RDD family protein n=1 Tax=Agrococcus sp. ARC_14 TaxID=2919927 RepID=UPI001F05E1DC|nr:RDD family protein [Agrococcus sp. ARC_14]